VKNAFVRSSLIVAPAVTTAGLASAQETVTMPGNATALTTLTAVVSDQARITVPSAVPFNVTNIAAATVASGVTFLADNIVLSSASATPSVNTSRRVYSTIASAPNFEPEDASNAAVARTLVLVLGIHTEHLREVFNVDALTTSRPIETTDREPLA
jgi:uncharacterized membrane protein YhiD involved in acid resistance